MCYPDYDIFALNPSEYYICFNMKGYTRLCIIQYILSCPCSPPFFKSSITLYNIIRKVILPEIQIRKK